MVWASIIGLILIYLAVGYFLGGRWADRNPYSRTMYSAMAWGAFLSGLVPLFARVVLPVAADAFDQLNVGILLSSFATVLVLFSIPVTLLGTISPFAIRLAISDPKEAGSVSGKVYAVSTLGSFIGTFLPVLILIPLVGTTWTFVIFSLFLTSVALIGIWLSSGWRVVLLYIWMPIVTIVLGLVVSQKPIKSTHGQIYETESAYNYIQVLEHDSYRVLRLNEGQGQHSIWHPDDLDYHGPWEQVLAAPFFNPAPHDLKEVESLAIVGLAAGTIARQASVVFGPIPIDGYEIDPEIINVARKFFGMGMPNLNAYAQDGRVGLSQSDERYSVISIDAYRPPYIPWHLTTREFFEIVGAHLTEDGVMVINVGRSPSDRKLVDGMVSTIRKVFPSVYVMDVDDSFNSIVYATIQPTDQNNLFENLLHLYSVSDVHPLLIVSIERTLTNLKPISESEIVFTDDWAPIEWITNNMVLNYVLFGDLESLVEGPGQ